MKKKQNKNKRRKTIQTKQEHDVKKDKIKKQNKNNRRKKR